MKIGNVLPIIMIFYIVAIFIAMIVQSLFLLKLIAGALMFTCGLVLFI